MDGRVMKVKRGRGGEGGEKEERLHSLCLDKTIPLNLSSSPRSSASSLADPPGEEKVLLVSSCSRVFPRGRSLNDLPPSSSSSSSEPSSSSCETESPALCSSEARPPERVRARVDGAGGGRWDKGEAADGGWASAELWRDRRTGVVGTDMVVLLRDKIR